MTDQPNSRPFRFSVELMDPLDGMTWTESARLVESLGYATVFVPDHMHEGYGPITAMATAAAATTTLKVGTMVFAADFRHPALLARELASIDVLSSGRLEVGVGAGYQETDYRTTGVPMDPPGVRVDRLIEHVEVLRRCFAGEPFDFEGQHYRIGQLTPTPLPHRPGGPPILLAGGGKRMLRHAAMHADIIGVNPTLPSATARAEAARDSLPGSIDTKFEWIREAAGDRYDRLEFNAWLSVVAIGDGHARLLDRVASAFGGSVDEAKGSPLVAVGTVDDVVDQFVAKRERWGYSYITIPQAKVHEFAPVVEALTGR